MYNQHELILLERLRALPPTRLAEVEDFVDFLRSRDEDRRPIQAAAAVAERVFQKVWDNSDDAEYDRL